MVFEKVLKKPKFDLFKPAETLEGHHLGFMLTSSSNNSQLLLFITFNPH